MTELQQEKLVIIGGGPAGLTAAIYGARAGLDPIVLMGPEPGGQITISSEIENFPGFPEGINGFDLMQKMIEQVEKLNGRLVYEVVEQVRFAQKPYLIQTDGGQYQTETVIVSTGASPRKLGLLRERDLIGSGISYCATCDGAFFKEQVVAVVGGGDVALEEAYYLTKFCAKVYIIHRREQFRGTQILIERVKNNPKIEILWDSEVKELLGENKLRGIIVKNNRNGVQTGLKDVRGLFIAIGYLPNTDLFKNELELSKKGYIVTDRKYMTNKEGIFAAGDVQDPDYRQIITSAGAGAAAAIEAGRYIDRLN